MTQYVIVAHNLTKDKSIYNGPYGDADYIEMYNEIKDYFEKQPDDWNCWIVELEMWPEGLPDMSV